MVAGLVAGAQVTCILTLPAMVLWVCFHYSAGGKPHAVLNFALTAAVAYFAFVPFPTLPSLQWTPAAIWTTFLALQTVYASHAFVVGGKCVDAEYEKMPFLKKQFLDDSEALLSDVGSGEKGENYRRARELAWGAHLLGAGCCMAAAIISGGAQDLCLLLLLPMTMNSYVHWLQRDDHAIQKFGAIFCCILTVVTLGFGIVR